MASGAPARTIERPAPTERRTDTGQGEHVVIVFDNDYNTFDEVIEILQVATGCSFDEALMETWEIHNRGRSLVHHADRGECERVAAIIRTIGIRVTVEEV